MIPVPSGNFSRLAHRRRLHDVEYTEKYKAREQRWPHDGTSNQCNQLPGNLVDDHVGWVFAAASARLQCSRRYPDSGDYDNQQQNDRNSRRCREVRGQQPPEQGRRQRAPSSRPRPQPAGAKERCDHAWPIRGAGACVTSGSVWLFVIVIGRAEIFGFRIVQR